MAERKSQNKFIPNDYDPKRFRTINNYHKHKQNNLVGRYQQPVEDDIFESLKDRPVDSFHRTITIRFEMPFNIWCLGCNAHIGMGVRFNAEKFHIGMYFSTPLFRFKMKCHLCPSYIIIKTDPKNSQYVIEEGARKRIEEFDGSTIGLPVLKDEVEAERMENDAFYRLENTVKDAVVQQRLAPAIADIQKFNDKKWKDPYELSRSMRRKFREEKVEIKKDEKERMAVKDAYSLSIDILPKSGIDDEIAKMVKFGEALEEPTVDLLKKRISPVFKTSKSRMKASQESKAKSKLMGLVQKTRKGDPFGNF